MSRQLSLLEAKRHERKVIRRIILDAAGGYRGDTDIDTERHAVHFRTSLILRKLLLF